MYRHSLSRMNALNFFGTLNKITRKVQWKYLLCSNTRPHLLVKKKLLVIIHSFFINHPTGDTERVDLFQKSSEVESSEFIQVEERNIITK